MNLHLPYEKRFKFFICQAYLLIWPNNTPREKTNIVNWIDENGETIYHYGHTSLTDFDRIYDLREQEIQQFALYNEVAWGADFPNESYSDSDSNSESELSFKKFEEDRE